MKKLLWVFVGAVIAVGTVRFVLAQAAPNGNAQSLGNHHQEVILTVDPGEMAYLPIPKQNFPVNVQVTVPEFFTAEGTEAGGPYVMTLMAADIQGGSSVSRPFTSSSFFASTYDSGAWCSDSPSFGSSKAFAVHSSLGDTSDSIDCASQISNAFVIGAAQPESGMPNRMMLGIPNPSRDANGVPLYGPVSFYIQMWY